MLFGNDDFDDGFSPACKPVVHSFSEDVSRTSPGLVRRNSSIELLRLLAMLLILCHHLVVHNVTDYSLIEPELVRYVLHFALVPAGKIGVVIFFSISAWYLADESPEIKKSFKRVWQMEKELLFYGVFFCVVSLVFGLGSSSVKSLLPLSMNVWWYATAYALFLLFMPFLTFGLRALGRRGHLALCLVSIIPFGILGLMPLTYEPSGVWSLIYLFVLISAYKWYLNDSENCRANLFILMGLILNGCYFLLNVSVNMLWGGSTQSSA